MPEPRAGLPDDLLAFRFCLLPSCYNVIFFLLLLHPYFVPGLVVKGRERSNTKEGV